MTSDDAGEEVQTISAAGDAGEEVQTISAAGDAGEEVQTISAAGDAGEEVQTISAAGDAGEEVQTISPADAVEAFLEAHSPTASAPPLKTTRAVAFAGNVGNFLSEFSFGLQALTLAAVSIFVMVAIVFRYLLHHALLFEDDLIQTLLIWAIFLGIGRSSWTDSQLRLGVLKRLTGVRGEVRDGLTSGCELAIYTMLIVSTQETATTFLAAQIPSMHLPQFVQSVPIAIGCAFGVVLVALRLVRERAGILKLVVTVSTGGAVWAAILAGVPSGAWVLLFLLLLMFLDVPLGAAIGIAGAAFVIAGQWSDNVSLLINNIVDALQNVAFIALPLFMVLGGLIAQTGLARDLGKFLRLILGWLPGGVGVSCVGGATILANMTGSALADTAALGGIFIPELRKSGYTNAEAGALQACAGLLGVVFPPSVVLIIWATLVNISVTSQFLAAIVPGVLLALMMAIAVVIKGFIDRRRRKLAAPERVTVAEAARITGGAVPVLMIPAILDAGIFSGVFAAFEAGAVAIAAATGLGVARRQVRARHLVPVLRQAGDTTTMVMLILAVLGILKYGLFVSGVDDQLGRFLIATCGTVLAFWIVVNVVFMIIHEFVEPTPAILLLAPFIVPLAQHLHISLLQLGAVIVVNSTVGLVLPPLGVNLYVGAKLAGAEPREVLRKVWPYLTGSLVVLVITCAFPALTRLL